MNIRKHLKQFSFFAAFAGLCLLGCSSPVSSSSSSSSGSGSGSGGSGSSSTSYARISQSVDTGKLVSSADAVSSVSFGNEITVNLGGVSWTAGSNSGTASSDAAEMTDSITIKNTSGHIVIDASASTAATKITFTGSISSGELEIKGSTSFAIQLCLSGASISSSSYPCINVTTATKTFLVLEGSSSLTDGRTYGNAYSSGGSSTKGTLYSKGAILVSGSGSLSVTEGYAHGIYSKDYIRIFGGSITVNNAGLSCIRSQNGFVMDGGTLTLKGTTSHSTRKNNNSRGIIVEGDESAPGEGFIYITGGTVNINTTGKAISAKWDIDEDAETSSTSDDPNPVVYITGGTFTIRTSDSVVDSDRSSTITYTKYNGETESEKESCSPEGIEGKNGVIIAGGTFDIQTTDDALNASYSTYGYVNISGGTLYLYSKQGDAIDSNGDINISGGTVVTVAPTGSEDGFDCDGSLNFTGGLAAGISGSSHSYASGGSSTQKVFVLGSSYAGSAGKTMAIKDSSGNPVFVFTIPSVASGYSIITLSSPKIGTGSYSIWSGVSASGGSASNGLYTSLPSVSGGSTTGTITTSSGSAVYMLGASSGMGGF
ncbi:MAG TPA: hypothetical protein DDW78_02935 [Treponema sp.]|nr:hypothetical protein [Treponema sp.]